MSTRLLRASAGTGKTYQLVQAYLAAVRERGLRPSQIVAITFTRKAAAELRSRIRRGLVAAGVDRALLAELSVAPIANFHGLALHLLRGFGLAGELPEGVEVLGEHGDDHLLFVEACEEAWFGDSALADAVRAVAPHLSVDRGLPEALWLAFSKAREDGLSPLTAELFAGDDPEGVRQALLGELGEIIARLGAARPEVTAKNQEKIAAFLGAVPDAGAPFAAWAEAWVAAAAHLDRRGQLGRLLEPEDLVAMRERVFEPVAAELCARLAPALSSLGAAAWRAYEARKRAERVVDFGDLVARVVELLATRAELHREVRGEVRAVLVDEAQDTNQLQRRMVRLLAGLEGPAAELGRAELFVVGDRKQAIYTFRGADPRSFEVFAEDVRAQGGVEEILTGSRRSAPELVEGINHLGAQLFGAAYEALVPLPDPRVGRVALGRPGMTWLELEDRGEPAPELHAREARAVAAWVRAFVDRGRSPGEVTILFAFMSRAPLVAQALTEVGIASLLGGGGGFYAQAEVVDLVALLHWLGDGTDRLSGAVALRSPLGGLDDATLFDLLRDQGAGLAALRAGALVPVPPADSPLGRLAATLPALVEAAAVMPAEELVRACISRLDARAIYAALPGGEQRLAHLDRLIELARHHTRAGRGGAAGFAALQLEHVHRGHDEPVASLPAGARRAVTLSSIHQAKGLEYPVVLLADLGHQPRRDFAALRYVSGDGVVFRPHRSGAALESRRWRTASTRAGEEASRELARLLYVAVTRARQEVVFVGPAVPRRAVSFAGLLGPWRAEAIAAGVLAVQPVAEVAQAAPGGAAAPTEVERQEIRGWLAAAERRGLPPGSTVELSVTAFAELDACLRRGHLVHDLKLDEPGLADRRLRWPADDDRDPPLDPLSRGRLAHALLAALARDEDEPSAAALDRALAGEGYDPSDPRLGDVRQDVLGFVGSTLGRAVLRLPAARRWAELPFRYALPAGPFTGLLHGQLDLLVVDEQGPLIIDYKHARPPRGGVDAYRGQLEAYATAVAQLFELDGEVRTRLCFLRGGGAVFSHDVNAETQRRFSARVAAVVEALGRWRGRRAAWPGQPVETCARLGCGFLARCHPGHRGVTT